MVITPKYYEPLFTRTITGYGHASIDFYYPKIKMCTIGRCEKLKICVPLHPETYL